MEIDHRGNLMPRRLINLQNNASRRLVRFMRLLRCARKVAVRCLLVKAKIVADLEVLRVHSN
jgi:hypothetical protein